MGNRPIKRILPFLSDGVQECLKSTDVLIKQMKEKVKNQKSVEHPDPNVGKFINPHDVVACTGVKHVLRFRNSLHSLTHLLAIHS